MSESNEIDPAVSEALGIDASPEAQAARVKMAERIQALRELSNADLECLRHDDGEPAAAKNWALLILAQRRAQTDPLVHDLLWLTSHMVVDSDPDNANLALDANDDNEWLC